MAGVPQTEKLERGLGLKEAAALNMIDMVGIGPFITIPLVIQAMAGPQCLLAWVAGAVLAVLDGFVWAELGAAMPQAGGSYVFLREAYGRERWGRLMSFLFIWQTMFQAPLVMASAAIGFAQYLSYLVPLGAYERKAISGGLIVVLVVLLYRHIAAVGKISLLLWAGVVGTIIWLIWGGATHFNAELAFTYPAGAWNLSWLFFAGLGTASVKTVYTYLGYYNVCHLGAEVRDPERTVPRSIFLSIGGIAILYLLMQTVILGVVPWQEAQKSQFIVSVFVERLYGPGWARVATAMILWVAFGSLFSLTLGYSRVPYAAALDGNFFSVFGRVHPTKRFPHVSLLALGAAAFVFSLLFRLSEVISAILAMRILVQFVGGAIGLMVLRSRWPAARFPFKMWVYPVPAVIAIAGWLAIFFSTGYFVLWGVRIYLTVAAVFIMVLGAVVFLLRAHLDQQWPFGRAAQ